MRNKDIHVQKCFIDKIPQNVNINTTCNYFANVFSMNLTWGPFESNV